MKYLLKYLESLTPRSKVFLAVAVIGVIAAICSTIAFMLTPCLQNVILICISIVSWASFAGVETFKEKLEREWTDNPQFEYVACEVLSKFTERTFFGTQHYFTIRPHERINASGKILISPVARDAYHVVGIGNWYTFTFIKTIDGGHRLRLV